MNESKGELTQAALDELRDVVAARGIGVYQWQDWDATGDPGRDVSFDNLGGWPKRAELAPHFAEAVFRNLTLLQQLAQDAGSDRLFVVTRSWGLESDTTPPDRWEQHFNPANYWMSSYEPGDVTHDPDDFVVWEHLFLSEVPFDSPSIVALLLLSVNDESSKPLIFDRSMDWTFRPCQYGGHVWAASLEQADQLKSAHPDWLTPTSDPVLVDTTEVEMQWGLDFRDVPEASVRALLDLAEERQVFPEGGGASLVDPRAGLQLQLGRRTALLLRALITGSTERVLPFGGSATELVTPERARQELSGDGIENLNWYLDTFVDETSYLDPEEAVDGVIAVERRDPALNYDGIEEPPAGE